MSKSAVKYFRKIEDSMGNGQCPECEAWMSLSWGDKIGHKKRCLIGKALDELGEDVMWTQTMPDNYQKKKMNNIGISALDL